MALHLETIWCGLTHQVTVRLLDGEQELGVRVIEKRSLMSDDEDALAWARAAAAMELHDLLVHVGEPAAAECYWQAVSELFPTFGTAPAGIAW